MESRSRRRMGTEQWEVPMDIRWIDRDGVHAVPLSQIRELIARDDGIV